MSINEKGGLRPYHHLNLDEFQIAELIGVIERRFGETWLSTQTEVAVGDLWKRRDPDATSQLVLLGKALLWAEATHPAWLDKQTKSLKSRDPNTRRGVMLELVAMHLLHRSGKGIRPTPRDFPGYDAIVSFEDGAELAVSVKNYGRSSHERGFITQARLTENAFSAALKANGRNGLVLAASCSAYPNASDWGELRAGLSGIVSAGPHAQGLWGHGPWMVRLLDTPMERQPLSSAHASHQVFIAAPFHPNERKNLLDKLDAAAANARRHAGTGRDDARAVLVRIPETFPADSCVKWADEYLEANANGPIDMVILYQLAKVTEDETTRLHHTVIIRVAASFIDWLEAGRTLTADIAVGTAGPWASRPRMLGIPDGALDDAYVHQSGLWHRLALPRADGSIKGDLVNPAPGINVRAVVRMPDGEVVLEGLFPPDGLVSLFD